MAKGFITITTKWLVVIRLLLGEIPDRVEFQQGGMAAALKPYLELTHAVRGGDVVAFNAVTEAHSAVFAADRVHHLVGRLRYNVIRSGLLRISLSYSRISLKVRVLLQLQNAYVYCRPGGMGLGIWCSAVLMSRAVWHPNCSMDR